jgi:hypothetical protein
MPSCTGSSTESPRFPFPGKDEHADRYSNGMETTREPVFVYPPVNPSAAYVFPGNDHDQGARSDDNYHSATSRSSLLRTPTPFPPRETVPALDRDNLQTGYGLDGAGAQEYRIDSRFATLPELVSSAIRPAFGGDTDVNSRPKPGSTTLVDPSSSEFGIVFRVAEDAVATTGNGATLQRKDYSSATASNGIPFSDPGIAQTGAGARVMRLKASAPAPTSR